MVCMWDHAEQQKVLIRVGKLLKAKRHYLTVCHQTLLRHMDANLNAYSRMLKFCRFTQWITERPAFSRIAQHHLVLLIIKHEDKQFSECTRSQKCGLVLIGQKQLLGCASHET